MFTWIDFWEWVLSGLVQNFIWLGFNLAFMFGIWRWIMNWKYGRWTVLLLRGEDIILERKVSTNKARECLEDESEKTVFLKGIVSPYGKLTCDIIEDGLKNGLLKEDKRSRKWIIHLDHSRFEWDTRYGTN